METEFVDILSQAASEIGLSLTDRQKTLFCDFRRELLLWNSKMNLISIKTPLDLPIKHCIDSLIPARFISSEVGSLLDIGSGAGFPGIPLKILLDMLSVTLLDASRKKTSFLRGAIAKLNLERTVAVQGRVEDVSVDPTYAGAFDIVISRAAFKLAELLEVGCPFLTEHGTLIAMKGQSLTDEWEKAMTVAEKIGIKVSGCHDLRLPILGDSRKIVVFTKS